MIFTMILVKLKSFALFFINIFRKALCCFKRRRRMSADMEPLSHIVVNETTEDLEQWNDWEFMNRKPNSVQEHIDYYRQQQSKLVKKAVEPEEEPVEESADLFGDMAPKITKQQKVLIGDVPTSKSYSLDVQMEDNSFVSNELENWEENSGWDKDTWDTDQLLREQKRQERERKQLQQQQKRLEKGSRPHVLGSKLGT